jgi:hypothetical protein
LHPKPEKPFLLVGAKGFEPSTPWSQTKCATKLRYAPTIKLILFCSRVIVAQRRMISNYKQQPATDFCACAAYGRPIEILG